MPEFDVSVIKNLAKLAEEQLRQDVDEVKEETVAALKELQDRGEGHLRALLQARLDGNDAEVAVRGEALEDIGVKILGVGTDALLDAADAVIQRWKGFVSGAISVIKEYAKTVLLGGA